MKQIIITLIIFCSVFLPGCVNKSSHYKFIGQVVYRRTYVGLVKMSEAEQDSVIRSNPDYMIDGDKSSEKVPDILSKLEIGDKDELFLDKIGTNLKDTIIIAENKAGIDSAYAFKLVNLKNNASPYIVFVNQYYIMNGDNYEVSVYEK